MPKPIVILGVFVADVTFRADRMPKMGETLLGNSFALGPGGKGSNQAVATAMAGAEVHMLTRLGDDTFGDMALDIWGKAGVRSAATRRSDHPTGAAFIYVDEESGDNAIIISPGVAGTIAPSDLEAKAELIRSAGIFITQLEQPIDAALRGFEIARDAGVTTILNPAPAATLPDGMLALTDIVTPNESEAEALTGIAVESVADAERASAKFLDAGVKWSIITLGQNGVFLTDGRIKAHVPARAAGPVVETTGAGDAFNGGFAAALSEGASPIEAARFGCATAGISVTRPGTAPSMPARSEIEAFLKTFPTDP